jgi:hypothetical protein
VFCLYGGYPRGWEGRVGGWRSLDYDEVERELKVAQMRADIENKGVDTAYKQMLARHEPTKLMISIAVATAAVFGTLFGIFGYILGRGH